MHVLAAIEQHWSRRSAARPNLANAGLGGVLGSANFGGLATAGRTQSCCPCPFLCAGLTTEIFGGKLQVWCLMGVLVGSAVVCIGMFEATRLTIHVLMSPCTVLGSEVIDVGFCTLCDDNEPALCEVHPIATARLAVTFKPLHSEENVTGFVWYCKGRATMDPCQRQLRFLDQLSLDTHSAQHLLVGGPVSCTVGEVFTFMQQHAMEGEERACYYSSRDVAAEDVWFSMPSPGLVDHAWFQKHLEYPVMLALGGLVLLSVLLGCLALEGAELWASGLV